MAEAEISHEILLHEILEEQVRRSRENVALEFHPDVKMTYDELNKEANRLARYLEKRKSRNEEVVALCFEKSPQLVIAVIATLKAGMAWVPIPMDAPAARISSILGACGARLVLCSASARHIVQDLASLIVLDDLIHDPGFLEYPDTNLSCDQKPSDLCHILFTSGSTGVPKGVALEHRAMMHCVWAMVKEFALTERTRTLQLSAATFDGFSLDLFMSIACGGCLVMAPPSTMMADMTAFMRDYRITYAHITPTVLDMVDPLGVPDFETLSSTGEALSENLANRWRKRVRLFNSYGPTETIVCTIQSLEDEQIDAACIGKAVQGLDVCLLTPGELDDVARGEVGEICVAGPHLFRGYVSVEKLPETALKATECFRNGIRYYRTGDMGKLETCPDGEYTLRYLGRRDGQVKVHGIRADLGDIEQSILACEAVKNCVVILPRSGPSQGRLCCLVTLNLPSNSEANSEPRKAQYMGDSVELLNSCDNVLAALRRGQNVAAARLPTHALPTSWWPVREFPRTSSGKIDRVKLRSLVENMDEGIYIQHLNGFACKAQINSSPEDIVEQQLQSLWADVLDRPISSIDTTVPFTHFGADSLDVIRFISKARARGIEFDIPQVYASKAIQQLARIRQPLLQHRTAVQNPVYRSFSAIPINLPLGILMKNASTICQIGVEDIEDIFGTTQYQIGLMTADLRSPGTYVCAFSWTLLKNIDIEKFRSSWEALLANEPVLRSRLIWDETRDGLWQVVVRHRELNWSKEYFKAPMSLGNDLCRGFLKWHNEPQKWKFFLKIHHSIIDGWSLRLMLNRLRAMYLGKDTQIPPRPSFAEFMCHRSEEEDRKQRACSTFWGKYLEGLTQLDFPPAPPESHHQVHATGYQSLEIMGLFQETAASFGVTQSTLLYAAVALLLSVRADSEDVTFGLILAGRESPLKGVFNMIGPAFATFPFRTRVERRMTMKSIMQRIEDHIMKIIPHQHYGLQRIRQCGEGASRACDFRCLVIIQPEDENLGGQGLWDEVHGQTSGRADSIPMTLELVLDDGKILVNCNFDPAFISHQDVGIMLDQLDHVLKDLETSTSRTDLLASQVKFEGHDEQLRFQDWKKRYGSPVNTCLHKLFHDKANQYSDRVAINDQGTHQQITYQELDACSGRLCNHIQLHLPIAPETMIPVVLTKSPLAIITILAVLKAGAAYVPIDPSWPIGRVRHIIHETRASVLLLCSPDISGTYRQGIDTTILMDLTDYSWDKKPLRADDDGAVKGCKHRVAKSVSSTNLACVLYTSGSTGLPKGVMLEHRALCTSLAHLTRVFAMKPGTRHLQFSSFVFDLSIADIFIPLFSGACICIPTEENRLNRLSSTVRDLAIESVLLTPSLADLISPDDAESLNTLMTAGEMMTSSLIRKWSPRVRLLNAYGLIETSIVTSVSDPLSLDANSTNVGGNVTAWHWIVRKDSTGAIYSVPRGCIGEIAVAGHILARGYVNNLGLTEKHFVQAPDLPATLATSRIYLTGDIGSYTADGSICLLGRNDQMVKVNGVRVEPGESEQQLRQQGGIFASCVVQWLHDKQSNAKLAAFVQVSSSKSSDSTASDIIAAEEVTQAFQESCRRAQLRLRDLLPVQYVPELYIPIRWIPYTTSGKVDLRLLKIELQKLPSLTRLFGVNEGAEQSIGELPVTLAEIALESSFRQIFGNEQQYHTNVDFFALGGDSFSSISLVSAARKNGWEISVEQIYRHRRLGDLAAVASPAQKYHKPSPAFSVAHTTGFQYNISTAAERCGLEKTQVVDVYPCTAMQEALMISSAKSSGSFFNQQVFKLADETLPATLETALQSAWARHAILRTRIILDNEYRSIQVVVKEKLEIDLATYQTVEEYLKKDIALVPRYGDKLSRCAILSCTSGFFLVISQHHAVYDGWSMNLLLADIEHQYSATNVARESPPAFSSFIHHVTELGKSPEAQEYWKQNLKGVSVTSLPQVKTQTPFEANQKYSIEVQLPVHDRHSLATIAEAAWGILLCRYTGLEDVTFGCVRAGRSAPVAHVDSIVGPTIVTVPRRVFAPRGQQVSSYLESIEAAIIDAMPWEQFGHRNIRKLSFDAHNACQFSSLLVVQLLPLESETATSKILIPQKIGDMLFKDDCLTVECQPRGNRLTISIMYDDRAIAGDEVAWISYNFARLLSELSSKPSQTAQELDVIGPKGTKQVQMWNSAVLPPTPTRVDDIFTERARDWPLLYAVNECTDNEMAMYRPGKSQSRKTQTSIEKTLQGLWAQIWSLDPSQIDLDSQFLSLGGDSLTAIRLATMCREIGYKLEVADILRNPRFEDLTMLMKEREESAPNVLTCQKETNGKSINKDEMVNLPSTIFAQAARICRIDEIDIEDIYPCTPTMEALIAVTARIPEAYIVRESFQIPPSVNLHRFCSAWDLVSRGNPIMRTRICSILIDGEFKNMQVVCNLPLDWNESASNEAFNAGMTIGSSLIRYRIRNSHEGTIFEVLKHHAVFDGYCSAMLWEDFQYAFEYSQPPPPRPPFKNYVNHICGKDGNQAAEFWEKSTSDFHGEHFPVLPSSQYTPTTSSSHRIETSLKWTNTCQFTFATVVRAAWAIVLSMRSRLSGQSKQACFAVTSSGRGTPVAGIDKMAGPTIATVPVVVELDMNQSIAEFLSQIHEQAISMLPYEYYGLSQIQQVSASAREASRAPNLLVVQPSHLEDNVLPLNLTHVLDDQLAAMVDSFGLVTECWQKSSKHTISLSALYDSTLMQEQEVNGILQQFSWLVAFLNRNSGGLFSIRAAMSSLAEEHEFSQLLAWNRASQCSIEWCLHELFETVAARQPHDLAVEAHDGKLTFAELNTAAIAVKEALIGEHDIGPGDLVPLCFEKSASMIVAIMGVLKAGAGYVPLDTSHPISRLNFIIREVKAKVVIVSTLQHNTLRFPVQTLALKSKFPFIEPNLARKPQQTRFATPKDVAYVIFTSGSTGHPKGVVMEHGAVSLSILEHGKRYQHDQRGNKTRVLQFSSYTFDASVLDIFTVLVYGGCVCIPSEEDRMGNLQEVFVRMRINFVDLTPTVAHLLDPAALPALTAMTLAGEMASRALIEKWCAREPPFEVFVNSYGPTEAAISCAVGDISPEKPAGHVGKQLGGYLWIVDEDDHEHLMPIGCVGELVISGPTLARGYLNDTEKTDAAFIRHVHWIAKEKYNVLYKTGDLARFDFEGNVEILGRKDDGQVKLNGLRIELGEIENSIQSCPQFSEARNVAVAKVNISGNYILAAFLQLEDCQATSPGLLLAHPSEKFKQTIANAANRLQNDLPQYMIPKLWIPVSSWPLNAAGKTDKKRLVSVIEAQTPAKVMKYLRATHAVCNGGEKGAKSEAEGVLEDAWKQVLNRRDGTAFEPHDDFFAVGGDSLKTITLISLLKSKGIRVTAQDIFGTKTLRNMANKVYSQNTEYLWAHDDSMSRYESMNGRQRGPTTTATGITDETDVTEIPPALAIDAGVEEVYPASHMQLSFLVECQKWCRAYYCWFFLDVGKSPIAKVQEACATVALRHQILRTSFHLIGDECHQVVQKRAPNFKVLFSSFSPADWCEQLDKDIAHPACFGEVLTRFRLLIDVETGRCVLALGLSHAQYDGFCTPTILNDLSLAYAGKRWENPSPPRYRDFIKHTANLSNEETDCFWREKLKGTTLTSIVRPLGRNARPIMSQGLKQIIPFQFKHSGTVSYPVMLKVAWAIALSQISLSSDITFGNLVSGRYAAFEGAQEVVGPCLNVIPFRLRIDTNQQFSGLLKDAHDQSIETIPFEATPFNRIAAQSPWPAAKGFDTIFQFQNIPGREEEDQILAGSDWEKLGGAVYGGGLLQSGACWLTVWPTVGGTARFLLRYSEETLETSKAEAVMNLFLDVLRLINNDPDASVASVSRLDSSTKTIQSQSLVPRQPGQLSSSSQNRPLDPALTPIIEELKSIWRSVVDFDGEIRPEDSFFDVGGDSIAAARLASVCVKMGLGLNLQDIIDCPSLISQVNCVAGRTRNAGNNRGEPKLVYEDKYDFI